MVDHTKAGAVSFEYVTPYVIIELGEIKNNRHLSTNLADSKRLIIRCGDDGCFSHHDEKKRRGKEERTSLKEEKENEVEKMKREKVWSLRSRASGRIRVFSLITMIADTM